MAELLVPKSTERTSRGPLPGPAALALPPEAQELLFTQARCTTSFSAEPVTDEQLKAIYDLVKWGPTALNGQPLRILFVRSPETRLRLSLHISETNRAKAMSAPVTAVLAADLDFHEHLARLAPHGEDIRDYFAANPAKREASARLNATIQAGYFLLGVRAAGLAIAPMINFDQAGVDREFFADLSWRSVLVVSIGKPGEDPWPAQVPRLDFDDATRLV